MIKVFDSHTHIFPDKIAARTVAELGRKAGIKAAYDGTREGLLCSMRAASIDGALNCPVATVPEQVDSINRWSASQNCWPIISLGAIHPDSPRPEKVLEGIRNLGLPGIKMHPEYQGFTLSDPRVQPIWSACAALGLVVVLHCGADLGFSPPYHSSPAQIRSLIGNHPNLKLVAAHFGSWRMWEAVEVELIGCPLYLDLSFTLGLLPDEKVLELVRRHDPERVLFGTDTPWRNQTEELDYFQQLPFTSAEKERILWQNAAKLFGFA